MTKNKICRVRERVRERVLGKEKALFGFDSAQEELATNSGLTLYPHTHDHPLQADWWTDCWLGDSRRRDYMTPNAALNLALMLS